MLLKYNEKFVEEKSTNEKSNIYKTLIKENDTENAAIENIDLSKIVEKTDKYTLILSVN